jgi:hypothetical protein
MYRRSPIDVFDGGFEGELADLICLCLIAILAMSLVQKIIN